MIRKRKKELTILFLCSPSLGILDNWLPVLAKLKSKSPELNLICLITKIGSVTALDLDSQLIRKSEKLFSSVIYKSYSSMWIGTNSLSAAKIKSTSNKFLKVFSDLYTRIRNRKYLFPVALVLFGIIRILDYLSNRDSQIYLPNILENVNALLYDVYEETKLYNRALLDNLKLIPRYSLAHGINIDTDPIKSKAEMINNISNITAYLFSEIEEEYYMGTYGLNDKQLVKTGIPRHDQEWIEAIQAGEKNCDVTIFPNYVLLISRSLSPYLTFQKKKLAVQNIKKVVIEELKLKLVIKTHPKEQYDGIFSELLGQENYGVTWSISNSHSFRLAQNCLFGITFYSGVAIDLIKLGLPVIEYLDLSDIPEFDNEASLRDSAGEPIFSYRFHNLVIGVSNYDDLLANTKMVLKSKDTCTNILQKNYKDKFYQNNNASEFIANDIIENIT